MSFAVLSRRKLLGAALAAGVFVVGGGAGAVVLRGTAPRVDALRALTDQEYRSLANLARALFPAGGGFAFSASDVDLARAFDGFLADEPEWNQADLKKALFLLEFGPVIFERRGVTFSHLDEAERLAHFERWMESDSLLRRQVATAFRKFMTLVFYDQPGVWGAIGYDGPRVTVEANP